MGVALTIAWKEFRSFLNSPLAYIFLIIFLLLLAGRYFLTGSAEMFSADLRSTTFWSQGQAELIGFFALVPGAFLVLIPALSMKLWPDELKSGTVELLLTYPIKTWQVVLGKWLAGMYLILLGLVVSLVVPYTVDRYGSLDWGPVVTSYLAAALMGGAFLSLGLFFGALFREQVTAFIVTAIVCTVLAYAGGFLANMNLPETLKVWGERVSFSSRFQFLARGVVPLADVLYFVTFGALFLVLNVTVIECRKGK